MTEFGDIESHGQLDPPVWDGKCGDYTCVHFVDYKCKSEDENCTYEAI